MPKCCPQLQWTLVRSLTHVVGLDFELGRCANCGQNLIAIDSSNAMTPDHGAYNVIAPDTAQDLLKIPSGPECKEYLRAWFDQDRLFPKLQYEPAVGSLLSLETPLGVLTSECLVNSECLSATTAKQTYAASNKSWRLARWNTKIYTVEVLLTPPLLSQKLQEQVSGCWAFLWRVRAHQAVTQMCFQSHLAMTKPLSDNPGGGECLEAQTWTDDQWMLSLGTQDSEKLYHRADNSDWFPRRFLNQRTEHPELDFVSYLSGGLQVKISELTAGEEVQIQFIAAWSPLDEKAAPSWLAVDLETSQILKNL